jgi:phenylacetate-coenzyme A ligase PaaK-like adenylate-forming protein
MITDFRNRIFKISNKTEFEKTALEVFHIQAENNPVYKDFLSHLGTNSGNIKSLREIPFLPIEFFRNREVVTGTSPVEAVFESSGTSGLMSSRHHVIDLGLYEESFLAGFTSFFGNPADYFIAGLLPSYIERAGSSLVYMVDRLIKISSDPGSGFFINKPEELINSLQKIKSEKRKGILIGVSFALLDLAEKYSPDLSGISVVETGGMKGRRKEITREELHSVLKNKLNVQSVCSEYGMTELLSQAWSEKDGIFYCPPWMKIVIRDAEDPLSLIATYGTTGGINIIDLANLHSCSFIASGDLGKLYEDGSFEVLGRFDNSDIRGCNLMLE